MTVTASPLAQGADPSLADYWRFHRAVAAAQLAAWLPLSGQMIIDLSGPHSPSATQAARAGHTVLRVVTASTPGLPTRDGRIWLHGQPGTLATVVAELPRLGFLPDGCADGVLADDRTLSRHIGAEYLAAEIARVLRPGGRLLASGDSLVLGMAMLAEQRQWAELTDLLSAEVLIIPWQDGTLSRCYSAQHLRDLCAEAGLTSESVRPRTVLSPSMVVRVLGRDPEAMTRLVRAELAAQADESIGIQLVVTARKPLQADG